MRLYRLLSRHGHMKGRPWPWFEPPAPDAPMKYVGWSWDPAIREWVETDIEPITVEVSVPKYPMPTEPPQKELPFHVPGWDWSEMYECWERVPLTRSEVQQGFRVVREPAYVPQEGRPAEVEGWSWFEEGKYWVATIIVGQSVEFTPPRTLPPNVDYDMVLAVVPLDDQYLTIFAGLRNEGMSAKEAAKVARVMSNHLWDLAKAQMHGDKQKMWQSAGVPLAERVSHQLELVGVYGAVLILATITGIVIGMMMERWTFVDEPSGFLPEPPGTYLMGPEEWFYSRNIGASSEGVLYYSKCEGIGTEYTRHKRGRFGGLYDIIDFPGGFLEEGYQFPYWVKYRWSHWKIVYVGMLYSKSARFYALKKEFVSLAERAVPVHTRPFEDWCKGFHWYL